MLKKKCCGCKSNRLKRFFRKNKSQNDGLHTECKKCEKNRRNLARKLVFDILSNCGGCADCGEANVAVLQFDHVRGKKTNDISSMINNRNSLLTIKKEMLKCDIVCSNCHILRTSKQFNWYANIR